MRTLTAFAVAVPLALACHVHAADRHGHAQTQPASASHSTAGAPQVHWGYSGAGGPEQWGELDTGYAACKLGKAQSPVDIVHTAPTVVESLTFQYQTTPLALVHNGHTIQANVSAENAIQVHGKPYKLVQFHLHTPSEHTIGGKQYPMELHLVHKNDAGQLAVVGVLMQPGTPHPVLQTLLKHLPREVNQEKTVPQVRLVLNDILPASPQYYHYNGSLTTPPCSEGVAWFVMKTPVEVSAEQIAQFTAAMQQNARPVQPLHQRIVLEKP
ncbi:MAG: carbonate dehydratase [Candidatus Tectomicrobia bacterium]|uniref:Carbonic anhydrase n=1 Tax=Tectimicrobiota bacterium TaxID=2528274 RepID=A0A937W3X6_UNCTE|nr:carbonate dehydratase [Candidatus Tectomicrobia bacterium]